MKPFYNFQAAVVGGDSRQIAVAVAFIDLFKEVKLYGHPQVDIPDGVVPGLNWDELREASVILLPVSGMNDQGLIRSYRIDQPIDFGGLIPDLTPGTLIVTGVFTPKWLQIANELGLKVLQYAEDDELAILNSIPTAEGAVQLAMEELPVTIHGSRVIVIGLGRVGLTTARIFKSLNAHVIVSARKPGSLARAREMGCKGVPIKDLANCISKADIIINTVPALILDETLLVKVKPESVIIDLASPPGGTDFKAAEKLNLKAILAPGLPGKVAPKTAGKILASAIPKMIQQFFMDGGA